MRFNSRNHKNLIDIKEIKTFNELNNLKKIIDKFYGGILPVQIFNQLYQRMTNKGIRDFFVLHFKPSNATLPSYTTPNGRSIKIKKQKNQKNINQPSNPAHVKSQLSVRRGINPLLKISPMHIIKLSDLTFEASKKANGYTLIYKGHTCKFPYHIKNLNRHVINRIEHKFKIFLDEYGQFRFENNIDLQNICNLINDSANKFHNEELTNSYVCILREIDYRIKNLIDSKVNNIKNPLYTIPIKEFTLNSSNLIYEKILDISDYISTIQNRREILITFDEIFDSIRSEYKTFHKEKIYERWKDGYFYTIPTEDLPNEPICPKVKCKVPAVLINCLENPSVIQIRLHFIPDFSFWHDEAGHYISHISENNKFQKRQEYYYRDHFRKDEVAYFQNLSTDTKLKILKDIYKVAEKENSCLPIMYMAYKLAFNETDANIETIYRKIKFSKGDHFHDRFRWNVRSAMICPLFEIDESTHWMWLESQIRSKRFIRCFYFHDLDVVQSHMLDRQPTNRKKAYIAIEEKHSSYKCQKSKGECYIYLYELDTNKKIYRFTVDFNRLDEAIFALWSYFSSHDYNKRENLVFFLSICDIFGIRSFIKLPSLNYNSILGYHEENWLE